MALLGKEDPSVLLMTAAIPASKIYAFFLYDIKSTEIQGDGWQKSIPCASCTDSRGRRP